MTSNNTRITYDELCLWLNRVSVVRRRAILFALETGMSAHQVTALTWKSVRQLELSELARSLVQANPRHLKLQCVFWETVKGVCTPLFDLESSINEVSEGAGLETLRVLYKNIIPVDREADNEHFLESILTEYLNRTATGLV